MKRFIVKLIVVVALVLALLMPVAVVRAHALVACPYPHLSCRGQGAIVCVDKHGRVFDRFHPHSHCIAI